MAAEIINKPQNHSVMFVKEADIIVTSNFWKIIVNFDLHPYAEAITTVRAELPELLNDTDRSVKIQQLQQIKTTLENLERKMKTLRYFSPQPERRRGLWVGGTALQLLCGVSTVKDWESISTAVNILDKKQLAISHSLDLQVSYLKQLDRDCKVRSLSVVKFVYNCERLCSGNFVKTSKCGFKGSVAIYTPASHFGGETGRMCIDTVRVSGW
jgi:hypothetical protein